MQVLHKVKSGNFTFDQKDELCLGLREHPNHPQSATSRLSKLFLVPTCSIVLTQCSTEKLKIWAGLEECLRRCEGSAEFFDLHFLQRSIGKYRGYHRRTMLDLSCFLLAGTDKDADQV